ncbi:MAG: hypothetical protein IJP48_02130 [Synergistaceae bacterium]|nr:hypothetical protein [Synergistaceae bacterium]
MLRKIFIALLIMLLSCAVINADSEEYDLAGHWNMKGGGFAKKSFVKSSLELTGSMNLATETLRDISNDITQIISNEVTININDIDSDILDSDMKALTEYDINLKLTATELNIKAWQEYLSNGIKIPVLIPDRMPAGEYNLTLPAVNYEKLKYQVTFTSASSGIVIISGYIDVDVIGECEVYSETSIWKDGTSNPGNSSSAKGGCNSGFGLWLIMPLILSGVIKRVWN